ncbi:MAG: hypothetical protein AAB874_00090 [Patescibacteria group bacterium]
MKNRGLTFFHIIIITICLYVMIILLTRFDVEYKYRWFIFFNYSIMLLLIPGYYFLCNGKNLIARITIRIKNFRTSDWIIFTTVVAIVLLSRFVLLDKYPFIAYGDELWDAGLDTYKMLSGEIKNFYTYAYRDDGWRSHGFLAPFIAIPFVPFWGRTVYMYRLPAAFIGSIEIIFLYLLNRKYLGQITAFFAALAISSMSFHLYFSRT